MSGVLCPNCGQPSRRILKARDLNRQVSTEQFIYYACMGCGLVYLFPIPLDLATYYTAAYPQYNLPGSSMELEAGAEATRPRLSFVQRFVAAGKLLEVGPGYGPFAYMAQRNGFQVEAIEMDPVCCQFMEKLGIRAICASSFDSVESLLGTYDVIALWHSIEHLENFQEALGLLAHHLSPSGVLVICTPNPHSLQFRIFRRFWVNLDAPRHLSLIPLSALVGCAAKHGLELAFASASDPEALAFSKWSWEASLANVLASAGIMPAAGVRTIMARRPRGGPRTALDLVRRTTGKLLAVALARALNLGLAPFERSGYRGACYTAVFRQKSCSTRPVLPNDIAAEPAALKPGKAPGAPALAGGSANRSHHGHSGQ